MFIEDAPAVPASEDVANGSVKRQHSNAESLFALVTIAEASTNCFVKGGSPLGNEDGSEMDGKDSEGRESDGSERDGRGRVGKERLGSVREGSDSVGSCANAGTAENRATNLSGVRIAMNG